MTPGVRVVRGEPDDVELAALVAGLVAGRALAEQEALGGGQGAAVERAVRRRWREGAQRPAGPLEPGPDAWRWSAAR